MRRRSDNPQAQIEAAIETEYARLLLEVEQRETAERQDAPGRLCCRRLWNTHAQESPKERKIHEARARARANLHRRRERRRVGRSAHAGFYAIPKGVKRVAVIPDSCVASA